MCIRDRPCSCATSLTKRALARTDMILAPLRTIRASFVSAPQNSSGSNMSLLGSNPRNASSKPCHFASMTLQAKPAENSRRVISASTRSSPSLAIAFGSGLGGRRRLSALTPPLRFSARAWMVLNAVMRARPLGAGPDWTKPRSMDDARRTAASVQWSPAARSGGIRPAVI